MSATETVMIESLDQFVKTLSGWHESKVKMLKHLQNIPEGTEVSTGDGKPEPLSGDLRRGFIIGLTVALAELGELPFEAELEIVDPDLANRMAKSRH